jgi:predicted permease
MALISNWKLAVRSLERQPGFALAAMLTLGLGLAAATVITTATRSALSASPSYRSPEELVILRPTWTPKAGPVPELQSWSYPLFTTVRDSDRELPALAAYTPNARSFNFSADGVGARRARVEMVSASYFGIVGVAPAFGRVFEPADDVVPGGRQVVLISDAFWRATLRADAAVLGHVVRIEKQPYTVIGVLPPGFTGLSEAAELWVPIATAPALTFPRRLTGSLSFWHGVVARVPAGERPAFGGRLAALAPAVAAAVPLAEGFGAGELSFSTLSLLDVRQDPALRRALIALSAAAMAVLLVAFVNVANLSLVRLAQRRREVAVRVAMGASRLALLREAVAENLLLAVGAMAVALALVPPGLALVRVLQPPVQAGAAGLGGSQLDLGALSFSAMVAGLAALVLAALATREDVAPADQLRGRCAETSAPHSRLRRLLVVAQLAAVLALATVAGLLGRSLDHLMTRPLGFESDHLLTLRVDLPRGAYSGEAGQLFFERAVERLASLPGVETAALANCLPLSGACDQPQMVAAERSGERGAPGEPGLEVWMNMVDAAYFRALGLPVVAGRGLLATDRHGALRVAVIDQTAAARYWPGADPVGQRIQLSVGWGEEDDFAEVVGVVGALPADDLIGQPRPGVYLAFAQYSYSSNFLVLRTREEPQALALAAERVIHELDADLAVWDLTTMAGRVRRASAGTRFGAALLGSFGVVALVLAALGVYGVVAFGVARRTREFGVRLALGSRRGQLLGQVLRETALLATLGILAGIGLALAAAKLVSGMVVTGSPYDPLVLVGASLLLGLVTLGASLLPAASAAGIDPIRALREG